MIKTVLTTSFLLILLSLSAQDAKVYYDKAIALVQQGKAEEAILFFNKSLELKSDEYVAWYNRGIAKTMISRYEDALPDFTQAISLRPDYKKAYLNRAKTRKHLTDYDGALEDYNRAILLDSNYAEAFYDRAILYNLLSERDSACYDFIRAEKKGYKDATKKVQRCVQNPTLDKSLHPILRLTSEAIDTTYGFSETNPVKVGTGPEGGPDNQRAYLDLLRDMSGNPVKYERIGSCCPYPSKHALFGDQALLDKYRISYQSTGGKEKQSIIYISFYDYEEPMILAGFRTVGR